MKEVRTEFPNIHIICMTGHGGSYSYNDVVASGATDYITKPFGMRELLARLKVVVRRMNRGPAQNVEETLESGEIRLDPRGREVQVRVWRTCANCMASPPGTSTSPAQPRRGPGRSSLIPPDSGGGTD